jgi:hypothetical protein
LPEGRPVTFYSRKLSGAELNYAPSDMEMLAVISALREWRCYLEGSRFTIVTDHEPNTYLDSDRVAGHTVKRRVRWLVESSSFNVGNITRREIENLHGIDTRSSR